MKNREIESHFQLVEGSEGTYCTGPYTVHHATGEHNSNTQANHTISEHKLKHVHSRLQEPKKNSKKRKWFGQKV
jgi:hypothetical protein